VRLKVGEVRYRGEIGKLEVRINGVESKSVSQNILYQSREV